MQQINSQSQKLGRGISALLGNNVSTEITRGQNNVQDLVKSIKIDKIVAGIYQPRSFFDEEELLNLSKSIAANGVIQPIIVRKANSNSDIFEIIAGERRYKASKMAGLTEIPAIIKDVPNKTALEFSIIENVQRSDLSPIEEGRGYKQLIEEFDYTQEKVAEKLGKSRSYVANMVRLLALPKEVQKMVEEGRISASHARSLIGKENALFLAEEIIRNSFSVRDTEELKEDYQPKKPEATKIVLEEDVEQKLLKKEYLKTLESSISKAIGSLKVKASYNPKKQKGMVTIFYNNPEEIENLISKLESKLENNESKN